MKTINIGFVCDQFIKSTDEVTAYINKCKAVFSEDKKYLSNSYEYGAIALYKSFEQFVLRIITYCLNHDHSHIEELYNIKLGKHLNDDVCEFLITKGGYFDFKGREGLLKILGGNIGKTHRIYSIVKDDAYKEAIEQLYTIRNYAAHNSKQSKKQAMKAFDLEKIGTAGSCLKVNNRLENIITSLVTLANEIKTDS